MPPQPASGREHAPAPAPHARLWLFLMQFGKLPAERKRPRTWQLARTGVVPLSSKTTAEAAQSRRLPGRAGGAGGGPERLRAALRMRRRGRWATLLFLLGSGSRGPERARTAGSGLGASPRGVEWGEVWRRVLR
uniref:Uncharacterized protein n=1 Tax=Rousettus aegyptiacus TaxID=9407 RepID=A0A7J8DJ51_ROUAE|nr:hypothetical protein HJG63_008727 [Rousettus aegyptiacus]